MRKLYNSVSDILNRYREEQVEENAITGDGDSDELPSAIEFSNYSKFVLISSDGMWFQKSSSAHSFASPLYLTAGQLDHVLTSTEENVEPLVAWVGKYDGEDYWVVKLADGKNTKVESTEGKEPQRDLESILLESCSDLSGENEVVFGCKPLREFGDSLEASHDAGLLATANGLVEFHKSHRFCSHCGSPTQATKAGASRTCTNESCRKSVYPRIDSAAIMLVTSPCDDYVLLGRKRSWPPGRYSTLAGFCEVGETLEECCQRETFEESGVVIDPGSVRFVASQPWPFPRSLMVGFRAKAMSTTSPSGALSSSPSKTLPEIVVDTNEMEDIRWFARDFVGERLKLNGSTALTFQPSEDETEFHIPGKASLARHLVTKWIDKKREKDV